jgi:hypothetical protein
LLRSVGGKKESFKLYGEHNLPHPAQIVSDSYVGTGTNDEAYNKTLTFDFKPQIVWLNGHLAVRPSEYAFKFLLGNTIEAADVVWGDKSVTFKRKTGTSGSGTRFNWIDGTYNYVAMGETHA